MTAAARARDEFEQGVALAKCRVCGCMREALEAISAAVMPETEAQALGVLAAGWLGQMAPQQYTCLGCPHCYPAEALNALNRDGALDVAPACAMATTGTHWPVVAGEYTVAGEGTGCPVAVSTLASPGLAEELARRRPAGLCIVGKTETENIGIEKVVKNVVSNPAIRYLVVAGTDAAGHRSGQTLLALAEHGVDERMRVVGSLGKRPVLRNATREEVEAFRRQVRVVDLIGCEDPERIGATVGALAGEAASKSDGGCSCGGACASASTSIPPQPTVIRAHAAGRVEMDRAGYFVILPDARRGVIVVEHYAYDDQLLHVVEGDTSRDLCGAIVAEGWVTQLSHAAYLGGELARAEVALRQGLPYVQDQAVAGPGGGRPAMTGDGAIRYQWLVTVRAADGETERVRSLLQDEMLSLLRAQPGCDGPRLAACIHCAGEHTCLATWPSEEAVVAFERGTPYLALLERLAPHLRVPPKRELWAVLGG